MVQDLWLRLVQKRLGLENGVSQSVGDASDVTNDLIGYILRSAVLVVKRSAIMASANELNRVFLATKGFININKQNKPSINIVLA